MATATLTPDWTRLHGDWVIETDAARYTSLDWTGQIVTAWDRDTGEWFWSTIEDAASECGGDWSYVALA